MTTPFVQPNGRGLTPDKIVTALVSITALTLIATKLYFPVIQQDQTTNFPEGALSLWQISERADSLRRITNTMDREMMCIPISAVARRMDQDIPPHARLFLDGVLGTNLAPQCGMYFFLRNYLFPREIEISMDGKGTMLGNNFSGVPYESEDQLRSNGFDALISFTPLGDVLVTPLTYTNSFRQTLSP